MRGNCGMRIIWLRCSYRASAFSAINDCGERGTQREGRRDRGGERGEREGGMEGNIAEIRAMKHMHTWASQRVEQRKAANAF